MKTPRGAYNDHKQRAAGRNIPFEFTFTAWTAWWEQQLGPDWLKKRGAWRGYYVMARFGDKGPYKLENVKCLKAEQNCSERRENGTTNSVVLKGRKLSSEHRAKIAATLVGNKRRLGHRHTPEAKARMSARLKGNKHFLGRKHTPEARARMSASVRAAMTPEHCAAISARLKGNKYLLGYKHAPRKATAAAGVSMTRVES